MAAVTRFRVRIGSIPNDEATIARNVEIESNLYRFLGLSSIVATIGSIVAVPEHSAGILQTECYFLCAVGILDWVD